MEIECNRADGDIAMTPEGRRACKQAEVVVNKLPILAGGKRALNARNVDPVPLARSTIRTEEYFSSEAATASNTDGLRARISKGSRRASQSAEKPLMRGPLTCEKVILRTLARWEVAPPPPAQRRQIAAVRSHHR